MIITREDFEKVMRGYDLDQEKLEELGNKCWESGEEMRKYKEDYQTTLDLAGGELDHTDPLYIHIHYNMERIRRRMSEALVNYYKCLHGKIFLSVMENYKKTAFLQGEIALLFERCYGALNLYPVEGAEDMLNFRECRTEEELFNFVRDDILDRMATEVMPDLKNIVTRDPDCFVIPQDKGARAPFDGKQKIGEKRTITLNGPKNKPMKREIQFLEEAYDNGLTQLGLGEFEKAVGYSLCTLWDSGTKEFSLQTIATMLKGNPDTDPKANGEFLLRIKDALRKLSRWVIIQYEQEAIAYKDELIYHPGEIYKYEGPLFHVRIDTVMKLNGTVTREGVRIVDKPILWTLAEMKAQFSKVPLSVFRTPGNLTEKKVELQMYLVERLTQMGRMKKKNASLSSLTIKWETLFQRTGNAGAKPSAKAKVKDKALAILDTWKLDGELLLDYAVDDEAIYIAIEEPHLQTISRKKNTK